MWIFNFILIKLILLNIDVLCSLVLRNLYFLFKCLWIFCVWVKFFLIFLFVGGFINLVFLLKLYILLLFVLFEGVLWLLNVMLILLFFVYGIVDFLLEWFFVDEIFMFLLELDLKFIWSFFMGLKYDDMFLFIIFWVIFLGFFEVVFFGRVNDGGIGFFNMVMLVFWFLVFLLIKLVVGFFICMFWIFGGLMVRNLLFVKFGRFLDKFKFFKELRDERGCLGRVMCGLFVFCCWFCFIWFWFFFFVVEFLVVVVFIVKILWFMFLVGVYELCWLDSFVVNVFFLFSWIIEIVLDLGE